MFVIAIDGGSAGGKTTMSKRLEEKYDCTVFHMDDFFLRPEQRTAERLAETGGNIDRERFLEEVLEPLRKNEPVYYRRFNCSTQEIEAPVKVIPKELVVIEGVYSMHPAFEKYYNLSVYLDISPEKQRERIRKRNTMQMAERYFDTWIPLENTYFSESKIKERCDIIVLI